MLTKSSREQDFLNSLSLHDYRKAIQLALAMHQPGRLLSLFKDVRSSAGSQSLTDGPFTGHPSVDEVIRTLDKSDLAQLLRYVRDWNANAKTSAVAQGVLYAVMKLRSAEDVMGAFESHDTIPSTDDNQPSAPEQGTSLKELVEALIPYTERHLSRMEKLMQDSYVVDYLLAEMDDGVFGGDGEESEMDVDITDQS